MIIHHIQFPTEKFDTTVSEVDGDASLQVPHSTRSSDLADKGEYLAAEERIMAAFGALVWRHGCFYSEVKHEKGKMLDRLTDISRLRYCMTRGR